MKLFLSTLAGYCAVQCLAKMLHGRLPLWGPSLGWVYCAVLMLKLFPNSFVYLIALQGTLSVGTLACVSPSNPLTLRLIHAHTLGSVLAMAIVALPRPLALSPQVVFPGCLAQAPQLTKMFEIPKERHPGDFGKVGAAATLVVGKQLLSAISTVIMCLIYPAPIVPYISGNLDQSREKAVRALTGFLRCPPPPLGLEGISPSLPEMGDQRTSPMETGTELSSSTSFVGSPASEEHFSPTLAECPSIKAGLEHLDGRKAPLPMGDERDDASTLSSRRRTRSLYRSVEFVKVPALAADGLIDCMVVRIYFTNKSRCVENETGASEKMENMNSSSRWMVYFGGNGEVFEYSWEGPTSLAEDLQANVILYNPRGVGRSTGYVASTRDLISDARAVVTHFMHAEGIAQEELLLFGHSIGGGVAASLAATMLPRAPLVLDRTFSTLADIAVRFSALPEWLTRAAIMHLCGDLNTIAGWNAHAHEHKRRLVIFHREDNVISYDVGSLARLPQFCAPSEYSEGDQARLPSGIDHEFVVELMGRSRDPHNVPMSSFPTSYREILRRMNAFFPQKE